MKLLLDRMLGNLASWLRILGTDAVYEREADDERLLERARDEDRILLTRDRELAERSRALGIRVHLLGPGEVADHLAGLHRALGLALAPKFDRCSLCNGAPLRPAEPEDLAGKDYVPEARPRELWVCPDCGQIYWEGGHWKNIRRVLEEARQIQRPSPLPGRRSSRR